jgi:translation initiation factor 1A
MVKNVNGGSKAKCQGRKYASSSKQSRALRLSTDECELYAHVTAYLGNGMCYVGCDDGIERLCHIRGKFRGRGKRDNLVTLGSWLLIGLREWATESTTAKKKQECDLLEVYSDSDKETLRDIKNVNWSLFASAARENTNDGTADKDDELVFSNEQTDDHKAMMDEEFLKSKETGKKTIIALGDGEYDIDVNDI